MRQKPRLNFAQKFLFGMVERSKIEQALKSEVLEKDKGKVAQGIYLNGDDNFNELYLPGIKRLAKQHWTPLHVTRLAVNFLAGKDLKILDIGSGVGKFCLAAACYAPDTRFYGIEQRDYLIEHARDAQKKLRVKNVSFIHGSFTKLDLREYDHFYFFNSFYENINDLDRIDEDIEYSESLFDYYVGYLYSELQQMPSGTKIATYHSFHGEIPPSYEIVESHVNGDLNFWIKR